MQTLTRRGVGEAAAGLSLHFLHMSEGPFSYDAGHIIGFRISGCVLQYKFKSIAEISYKAPSAILLCCIKQVSGFQFFTVSKMLTS